MKIWTVRYFNLLTVSFSTLILSLFLVSCNALLSDDESKNGSENRETQEEIVSEHENTDDSTQTENTNETVSSDTTQSDPNSTNNSNQTQSDSSTTEDTKTQTDTTATEEPKGDTTVTTNTDKGVGTSSEDDGSAERIKERGVDECFWGELGDFGDVPLVKIQHAIGTDVSDFVLIFNPNFVDNTYGENRIGFKKRTFNHVYKSDHVEVALKDKSGTVVFHSKIDLISPTDKVETGYATLGPFGGDGELFVGDKEDIISFGTTMDDNFNHFGYPLTDSSPETDENYTPNPDYPDWEYKVAYRLTVKSEIFGTSGYGSAHMTSVHASPAKNGPETIEVNKSECPDVDQDDPFKTTVEKKYDWLDELDG